MNTPHFIWFSSVNECKHMPDQAMLVLYPASSVIGSWHPSRVCGKAFSRSIHRHTHLYRHAGNPIFGSPHSVGISIASILPPCLQNSSSKNPPLPSEILNAVHVVGMDIFWNNPISETQFIEPVFLFLGGLVNHDSSLGYILNILKWLAGYLQLVQTRTQDNQNSK